MKLTDVYAMHKAHPDTFDLPEHVGKIRVGDYVKLGTLGERAWVVVTSRKGARFVGKPTNDMTFDGAKTVRFTKKNVYDWMDRETAETEEAEDDIGIQKEEGMSFSTIALVLGGSYLAYQLLK